MVTRSSAGETLPDAMVTGNVDETPSVSLQKNMEERKEARDIKKKEKDAKREEHEATIKARLAKKKRRG